jgi:hypothetical protein
MYPISLSTGISLQVKLLAAPATINPLFTCTYADTSPEVVSTRSDALSGTLPVAVAFAPVAGERIVRNLIVFNRDTAQTTVIYQLFNGTTAFEIWRWTLDPGEIANLNGVFRPDGSLKSGLIGPQGIQGVPGANGVDGVDGITPGLVFDWAVATTTPPAAGELRANTTTYSSIAQLFVSESDRNAVNISSVLSQITPGSLFQIQSGVDPSKYAWFTVSSIADNGSDRTITVIYRTHVGTFANGEDVSLAVFKKGTDGGGVDELSVMLFS